MCNTRRAIAGAAGAKRHRLRRALCAIAHHNFPHMNVTPPLLQVLLAVHYLSAATVLRNSPSHQKPAVLCF